MPDTEPLQALVSRASTAYVQVAVVYCWANPPGGRQRRPGGEAGQVVVDEQATSSERDEAPGFSKWLWMWSWMV